MSKATILSINECDYGSTGTIAKNVLLACESNGFETLLATFETKSPYKNEIIISKNKPYNFVNRVLCRIGGGDGFFNKTASRTLIKKIEHLNISLIHLHNIHGRYINLPLILKFAYNNNIPIVWTLHDCWAFTGRCPHFEYINCYKWKKLCNKCPSRKEYPASLLFDGSAKYFRKKQKLFALYRDKLTIVSPSNWLDNHLSHSILSCVHHIVIHNGINSPCKVSNKETEEMIKKYSLRNKKVFLFITDGVRPKKGFQFIKRLSKELDASKYAFIVVGINNLVLENNDSIINVGYVSSRDELAKYYTICDALINPTLEDNFPTVNLEALSYGKPVITFDTGGSPESIDSKSGVVVEKQSYEELKTAVISFDKTDFSKEECYNAYLKFTTHKMCEQYVQLFKNLMEKK